MSENIDKEKCINDNNENEQNKEEINKNIDNKDINPPPLETEEEDGINKEDIKDIVDYLSNLDYEKYSRDMEIKEALMILKTKMDKYQEEKGKEQEIQNEKIKIIEDNNLTIFNKNKDVNQNQNNNDEEKINYQNQNKIYMNKIEDENKNINTNEIKEPKEIIDEEEVKKKEKIEKYKIAEKIAKISALKDVHSVQSVQKLLLRENIDDQAPLRITIIKENPLASCDGYIPNKLPFLRSLPLV
jgi:hypothetical protein